MYDGKQDSKNLRLGYGTSNQSKITTLPDMLSREEHVQYLKITMTLLFVLFYLCDGVVEELLFIGLDCDEDLSAVLDCFLGNL